MSSLPPIEKITQSFELLPEWEERYRYLIDLGRKLPTLAEEAKVEENLLKGCVSQVWLVAKPCAEDSSKLNFEADSDAHIVRGLTAVVLAIFADKTTEEIGALDPKPIFAQLGLETHLLPSRVNGLTAMVGRIKELAAEV